MKIAICEDNLKELEEIKELIEKTELFAGAEYFLFSSGSELVNALSDGLYPDFAFLDVDMPGKNGIETGREINEKCEKTIIIFITAYPQYAIDAYDSSAFHYLLKTDSFDRFSSVLKKAVNKYKVLHRFYVLKTKNGPVKLEICDIYYVEHYKKQLYFHTSKGLYEVRMTLEKAYEELKSFDFCKVHQGYIVNMEKEVMFGKEDVCLDNGEKVSVSLRKRSDAVKAYAKYLERNY